MWKDPRKTARWQKLRVAMLAVSDRCWICGRLGATEIDHKFPLARGGDPFDPTNLAPAHRRCNASKGATVPADRVTSLDRDSDNSELVAVRRQRLSLARTNCAAGRITSLTR